MPIDLVTVLNCCRQSGDLEKIGGPAFIAGLTDGLPRAVNVEHYARIVKEKAQERRLLSSLSNAQTAYLSGNGHVSEALQDLKTALAEVDEFQEESGPSTWRTVACDNPDDWQHIAPVEWCCEQLIPRNSLGFIGGGPKDGKSVLMLDLMIHMAHAQYHGEIKFLDKFAVHGAKVFYVSKEDGMERLFQRWPDINQSYGYADPPPGLVIVPRKMSGLMLTDKDHIKWLEENLIRTESNFLCLDVFSELIPGIDEMQEIRLALNALKVLRDKLNITIAVIDHTRKMPAGGGKKFKNENQDLDPTEIRGAFKFGASDWVIMVGSTADSNKIKLSIKCKDAIESVQGFMIRRSPLGSNEPKHVIEATMNELAQRSRERANVNRDNIRNSIGTGRLNTTEIAALVGLSVRSVQRHCNTMVRNGELHAISVDGIARYAVVRGNERIVEQAELY